MNTRILVVDDNPDVLYLMRLVLAPEGWEILTTERGLVALDMARYHHPDLVLLDLVLPDVSGYELITRMRQIPWARRFPIVVFTGLAQPNEHDLAFQLGATAVITKPIAPEALVERLKALL